MKSWLNVFLPNDEYKRHKTLYYIAEGGTLVAAYLILAVIAMNISSTMEWNSFMVTGLGIIIFIFYVFFRYTFSGMEYTEVMTKSQFVHSKKELRRKCLSAGISFTILLFLFYLTGLVGEDWYDPIGLGILYGVFYYAFESTSLKQSYNKNKNLTDE